MKKILALIAVLSVTVVGICGILLTTEVITEVANEYGLLIANDIKDVTIKDGLVFVFGLMVIYTEALGMKAILNVI